MRWDGWKLYNSANYYERLCLSFDSNASPEQIEENCRQLLIWWQKKLPLKNQPSNPLSQLLRAGLDEAPIYLVEARTVLLDPVTRKEHDTSLRAAAVEAAGDEFKKLIGFALSGRRLRPDEEERLVSAGVALGLSREEACGFIAAEVERTGTVRVEHEQPAPPPARPSTGAAFESPGKDPFEEFRRLLMMSRLCRDGEDMTDDQRDAMCNLGESLGLTGGQAEDLIDEYIDHVVTMPIMVQAPTVGAQRARSTPFTPPAAQTRPSSPAAPKPAQAPPPTPAHREFPNVTPLMRAQEKENFPNFVNMVGAELYLVTSGAFTMGSTEPDALPNEQPLTRVFVSRFYLARYPITNAQYECFDPAHTAKRAPSADEHHPVVYVTALEAERFCEWISRIEGRRYRLPTEAEWEYAARGTDGRQYPWGEHLDAGHYANFADCRSNFPWSDQRIDDGWAQSSPVGAYPKGASPFGIEDMAGNVLEWCLDGFEPYRGKDAQNPRGPRNSIRRNYRGGSWKSRAASVRACARHYNSPDYSSNDVGFRIVCECA